MDSQYREFPGNWTQDELTKFIDLANSNVVGTFGQDTNEYPLCSD